MCASSACICTSTCALTKSAAEAPQARRMAERPRTSARQSMIACIEHRIRMFFASHTHALRIAHTFPSHRTRIRFASRKHALHIAHTFPSHRTSMPFISRTHSLRIAQACPSYRARTPFASSTHSLRITHAKARPHPYRRTQARLYYAASAYSGFAWLLIMSAYSQGVSRV